MYKADAAHARRLFNEAVVVGARHVAPLQPPHGIAARESAANLRFGQLLAKESEHHHHCGDTLDSSSVNTARFQLPATAATSPHTAAKDSQSAGMARFPVSWMR